LNSLVAERTPMYERFSDLTVDAAQSPETIVTTLLNALSR